MTAALNLLARLRITDPWSRVSVHAPLASCTTFGAPLVCPCLCGHRNTRRAPPVALPFTRSTPSALGSVTLRIRVCGRNIQRRNHATAVYNRRRTSRLPTPHVISGILTPASNKLLQSYLSPSHLPQLRAVLFPRNTCSVKITLREWLRTHTMRRRISPFPSLGTRHLRGRVDASRNTVPCQSRVPLLHTKPPILLILSHLARSFIFNYSAITPTPVSSAHDTLHVNLDAATCFPEIMKISLLQPFQTIDPHARARPTPTEGLLPASPSFIDNPVAAIYHVAICALQALVQEAKVQSAPVPRSYCPDCNVDARGP